ncbi:hypothetical protein Tco_1568706 [Tanacetum coccineum]
METKDTSSSCSNSEEQQMQQIHDKAKKSCMVYFRLLTSHLKVLTNNDLKRTRTEGGLERAFATLFDEDVQTFTGTMLLNLDQLEKQLDKEEFQKIGSMNVIRTKEGKVDSSKALDDGLVVTESSGAKSGKHDTSDISGNDTHVEDADIRLVNDQEPWYRIFNKRTKK